ncbi:DNA damage-binding protein 1 [Acrasis kona]|uniref:DNA damage-binding protein 1 n=1 Tax=Acrasis kona TaxID=1008807 RepID=A0AAW2YHA4_9EUKA
MSWNYAVTAYKPSSIRFSLTGNFTGPLDRNLIVGKNNQLEIWTMAEEGIEPKHDVPIYGRISTMSLYRQPGKEQDLLLITTEKYKMVILEYDSELAQPISTKYTGDISDTNGRETENGQIIVVDPLCRCIIMHLYEGTLKILPLDTNKLYEAKPAYNVRLDVVDILDIKMLSPKKSSNDPPVVVILYQDSNGARHVKSHYIDLANKELKEGPFQQSNVDSGSNTMIPLPSPHGGVVLLGERSVVYHDASTGFAAKETLKPISIRAYGQVDPDGTRWLLADASGSLYMLQLKPNSNVKSTKIQLEDLGETCIPSTVSYCDAGFVFVGSMYGDSQLIKLHMGEEQQLQEVYSYTNLGPIVDLCVVDIDKTNTTHADNSNNNHGMGQCQVVTCSGGFKDGSLRVIRNGIGIEPLSVIDLAGIKGLWPLRPSHDSANQEMIVISFLNQTHLLGFDQEDNLGPIQIPGLITNTQTLCCATMVGETWLQVTDACVRLVSISTKQMVSEWRSNQKILMADATSTQVLLTTGEGRLIYLQIIDGQIQQIKSTVLDHEVSCISIQPFDPAQTQSSLACVGMWHHISVRLLSLPELNTVLVQPIAGQVLPRSVLMVRLEQCDDYLMVALGDGHLITFKINQQDFQLGDYKKISLGTKPITLSPFMSKGQMNVFACSDRPAVIYSQNKKLLFSNVNQKDVSFMCGFNSQQVNDAMAIALEGSQQLMIGTIDEIQKLHIKTIPLQQQPRRICYQESTNTFAVITSQSRMDQDSVIESSHVLLLNADTFDQVFDYRLDAREEGWSIVSATFGDKQYYVVGTAYVLAEEDEPTKGRVLVFEARDNGAQVVLALQAETEVKGPALALQPFHQKLIVAVGGKILLYRFEQDEDGTQVKELLLEHVCRGSRVTTLTLQSRGDFILAGDIMKSVSLLNYKPLDGTIEEIARDYGCTWLSTTEMLDDDHFLYADSTFNICTLQKNHDAVSDEAKRSLVMVGKYHLGDFVNKFAHGRLVMNTMAKSSSDHDAPSSSSTAQDASQQEQQPIATTIYGTRSGAIGVIAQLPQDLYQYMHKVQHAMRESVVGIGGLKHQEYRAYRTERRSEDCENFLDGDLIEEFINLSLQQKQQVVDVMKQVANDASLTVDAVTNKIEELASQLH